MKTFMKTKKIFMLFTLFCISFSLFSQENTENEISKEEQINYIFSNFVAGSLFEKVEIVKSVEVDSVPQTFFEEALNFAVSNKNLIESHPSYYPLILSSLKKLNSNASENIDDLLLKIYQDFSDYNVRLAVLKALSLVKVDNVDISILATEIISQEMNQEDLSNIDIFVAAINVLSNVKYLDAFDLLFTCYKKNITEEVTIASCNALYVLSPLYNDKILNIVETGDLRDKTLAFNLVTTNPKKDKNFSAEIAAKLLFETINISGEVSELSQEQISLQLAAFNILEDSKWTKETELVLKYFKLTQKEYYELMINEDEFTSIIYALKEFPTTQTCKALTDFLASQYSETISTGTYNHAVLLAVISTLGELGDKDAFDTLLYVISCPDYPDDIISASRDALEKLKWKW